GIGERDHLAVVALPGCVPDVHSRHVHWRLSRVERHLEPEAGAARLQALETDPPAHGLDQAAGDGRAQARAAIATRQAGVGLLEGLEQALAHALGNADAGIADNKAQAHAAGTGGAGPMA